MVDQDISDTEFLQEVSGLRCGDCDKIKDDVHDTYCPFESEIHNKSVPIRVCHDCYQNRYYEI